MENVATKTYENARKWITDLAIVIIKKYMHAETMMEKGSALMTDTQSFTPFLNGLEHSYAFANAQFCSFPESV